LTGQTKIAAVKSILTVPETAECLRVSRSTVWRWCRDGTLSSAFKIGRNWRIHRSEIEEIIEQSLVQNDEVGEKKNARS
jgi:excisionase family DNA binding protein